MNEEMIDAALPETIEEAPIEEQPPTAEESSDTLPTPEEPAVDYAQLAAEDLAEIKRLDPSYAPAAHLGDLPFARRFAELRDLGLSVKEALAAAAPRFERADTKGHLRAVAPRGARAPEGMLDRDGMREAKLLFGNLSDTEINALYRRVTQSNY